jgi:hypothetical protein
MTMQIRGEEAGRQDQPFPLLFSQSYSPLTLMEKLAQRKGLYLQNGSGTEVFAGERSETLVG